MDCSEYRRLGSMTEGLDLLAGALRLLPKVVLRLHSEQQLGRNSKCLRQTNRHIRGDR
jgi:hypothetical protein